MGPLDDKMAKKLMKDPHREDITLIREPQWSLQDNLWGNPWKHLRRKNDLWVQTSMSKQLYKAPKDMTDTDFPSVPIL